MDMIEYVADCVNQQYLSVDASATVLTFYSSFRERYDGPMDAAPSGDDCFMLACDNGKHIVWFELIVDRWEFFYRDRETDEMYSFDFVDLESVDKYIRRALK